MKDFFFGVRNDIVSEDGFFVKLYKDKRYFFIYIRIILIEIMIFGRENILIFFI